MCDIYEGKCECCGKIVSVHIGDYSASRQHVHPFCGHPGCAKKMLQFLAPRREGFSLAHIVFSTRTSRGGRWYFVVNWPHHIEVNE